MKVKNFFILAIAIVAISCNEAIPEKVDPIAESPKKNIAPIESESFFGKDYFIDDQHSYLGFKIKYFGNSPVRGRLDSFDGTLFYHPDHLDQLSVTLFGDISSINTGNKRRDNDLKSEDTWFDVASHPTISFQSTEVITYDNQTFDLVGDLTIKGITLRDTIIFNSPTEITRDWAANEQVDFSGKVTINRQDYGVFGGDFWSSLMENGLTQLSDEVEIEIDMHCRRADYLARMNDMDSTDIRLGWIQRLSDESILTNEEQLRSEIKNDSLRSSDLTSIAKTLAASGIPEKALEILELKLQLFPEVHQTHNQLGVVHLHLDQIDEAKASFETTLTFDDNNSMAREYLRLIQKL